MENGVITRTIEFDKRITVRELKEVLSNFTNPDSLIYCYDEINDYSMYIQSICEASFINDRAVCALRAAEDVEGSIETLGDLLKELDNFEDQSFDMYCIEIDYEGDEVFRRIRAVIEEIDMTNGKITYFLHV